MQQVTQFLPGEHTSPYEAVTISRQPIVQPTRLSVKTQNPIKTDRIINSKDDYPVGLQEVRHPPKKRRRRFRAGEGPSPITQAADYADIVVASGWHKCRQLAGENLQVTEGLVPQRREARPSRADIHGRNLCRPRRKQACQLPPSHTQFPARWHPAQSETT